MLVDFPSLGLWSNNVLLVVIGVNTSPKTIICSDIVLPQSNCSILASRCVQFTIRWEPNNVNRTKMPFVGVNFSSSIVIKLVYLEIVSTCNKIFEVGVQVSRVNLRRCLEFFNFFALWLDYKMKPHLNRSLWPHFLICEVTSRKRIFLPAGPLMFPHQILDPIF